MATRAELASMSEITRALERVEDVMDAFTKSVVWRRLRHAAAPGSPSEEDVLSLLDDIALFAEDRGYSWTVLIGAAK